MSFIDDAIVLVKSGEIKDLTADLLSDLVQALQGDLVSTGKVIYTLEKTPSLFREKLFWSKMEQYMRGIFVSEEDRAKLRAKLTENGSSDENTKRLIECIDRAETSQKIRYLINATRCLLTGFIDRPTFFRLCHAITGTIDEDLLFVRDHITEERDFGYSQTVQGLFISGLVTFRAIGGEETRYAFTPLAEALDRFAISYDDANRYPNPVAPGKIAAPVMGLPTATDEETKEMLDEVFGKSYKNTIDVSSRFS